jgi:N6-adenosine-specific RNA methylase IME4
MKYRTIVADPPWPYGKFGSYSWREGRASGKPRDLPYATMTLEEIADLPVRELAEPDAHLYVWTTQRYLLDTYRLVEGWGFKPGVLLVWCKSPHGFNPGGAFGSTVEFILTARRGYLAYQGKVERQWWNWPRGKHSAKPEAFLDIVEQVSPSPYLELFARRNRLGWDTWGNESIEHVELASER